MGDIIEKITATENLSHFLQALETTELVEMLKTPGPYTVFAPTDEAFAQLGQGNIETALQDPEKLKRITAYHLAFGDVRTDDLLQIDEVTTVEGSILAVEVDQKQIKLNNAKIIGSEIVVDNGVIYLIDQVLSPALVLSE